jgi:hypothetical protein
VPRRIPAFPRLVNEKEIRPRSVHVVHEEGTLAALHGKEIRDVRHKSCAPRKFSLTRPIPCRSIPETTDHPPHRTSSTMRSSLLLLTIDPQPNCGGNRRAIASRGGS